MEVNSSSASKGESGSNLNAVIHEKDRQLQAFKQGAHPIPYHSEVLDENLNFIANNQPVHSLR